MTSYVTNLHFTNPLYMVSPEVFDLGDAADQGSVLRYLTAAGGIPPYAFSVSGTNSALLESVGLTLSANGMLSGILSTNDVAGLGNALWFEARVMESGTNGSVTGAFRLGLVSSATFRFAVDKISDGALGLDYTAKIETVGGTVPAKITVVAESVKVDGEVVESLESIGLSLAADGTVYGRPLVTGSICFTAKAEDSSSSKKVALGRSPATSENQVISLVVKDSEVVTSSLTGSSLAIKVDKTKANADTIKYKGVSNLNGVTQSDLNGKSVYFRIGNKTYAGALDSKGKYSSSGATEKNSTQIKSKKGGVSVSISKADLSEAFAELGDVGNNEEMNVPLQVIVDGAVVASEVLRCVAKVVGSGASAKYTITYKIGKTGDSRAGGFQLIQVKGSDKMTADATPVTGAAWKTKFYSLPQVGVESRDNPGFDGIRTVTVMIGESFEDFFDTLDFGADVKIASTNTSTQISRSGKTMVKKVKVDGKKFVGALDTNPISAASTGYANGAGDSDVSAFSLVLALNRAQSADDSDRSNFVGISAKKIKGKSGKGWVDKE
jgi:hypothetical protein